MPDTLGFVVTRQDLADHEPTKAKPAPAEVHWFTDREKAVTCAKAIRAQFPGDTDQLILLRKGLGFCLRVTERDRPEVVRSHTRVYSSLSDAEYARMMMLFAQPGLHIQVIPYIRPERPPPAKQPPLPGLTIDQPAMAGE